MLGIPLMSIQWLVISKASLDKAATCATSASNSCSGLEAVVAVEAMWVIVRGNNQEGEDE